LNRLARTILCAALLLPPTTSLAQDVAQQFLPELDVYHRFADSWGFLFQAKNTKESGESTQAEFGPSLTYDVNRWRTVNTKAPLVSTSIGYRYLPSPAQPPTNRLEPVVTFNFEARERFVMWDRNRGDLDWQQGTFQWRYRNRLNLGFKSHIRGYELTPYGAVEVFYESKYSKWSDTALYAGCLFPVGKHFVLDPYYEHQNATGNKKHNEVYDQVGLVLRMYF
jgi:hypothetical protein